MEGIYMESVVIKAFLEHESIICAVTTMTVLIPG